MNNLEKAQQVLKLMAELDLTLHEVLMADCIDYGLTVVNDIYKDDVLSPEERDVLLKETAIQTAAEFSMGGDLPWEEIYSNMFD